MFVFEISLEGIFLVVAMIMVVLSVCIYLFRVWSGKRQQCRSMERLSGASSDSFDVFNYIEALSGLHLPGRIPQMSNVQPLAVDADDEPTLDMKLG